MKIVVEKRIRVGNQEIIKRVELEVPDDVQTFVLQNLIDAALNAIP